MVNEPFVSPSQVRAARAWLCWSQNDLSMKAGVSQRSIARFELERSVPYAATLAHIRGAFETAGIGFQWDGLVPKGICVIAPVRTDRADGLATAAGSPPFDQLGPAPPQE